MRWTSLQRARASAPFFFLCACARPPEACFWAVDRGAEELVVLDRELLPLRRIPVLAPERLVPSGEDAAWVTGPCRESGAELERLVRLSLEDGAGAQEHASEPFGEILDLVGARGDAVVLLERSQERVFLWRVEALRGRSLLGAFPRARCVAAQPGELLIGCADGLLARLEAGGAVLAWAHGAAPVRALAPGPRSGSWWVLRGEEDTWLELLEPHLEPLWSVRTSIPARSLASVAGAERVWIAGGDRACRYGPGGLLELAIEEAGGPWAVASATPESVLLWSAGAILEVDVLGRRARVKRSQGGFRKLTGLSSVRSVSAPAAGEPPPGGSFRLGRSPARAAG